MELVHCMNNSKSYNEDGDFGHRLSVHKQENNIYPSYSYLILCENCINFL